MNKIGFVLSGIFTIIGIIILFLTSIINLIIPKIGLVAFQVAAAGSYSPSDYHINFIIVNISAIFLVCMGIILGYRLYKNEKKLN